ncbi:alkyl hydroperoxide reductase Thiol specific antioxidant Mal allergen [Seminavis robusta]|uniref:Alkyl hydroperoxide reductase Thiol specific antioxidant Mal allergen n=1 Tax=Seminavis robusta TaxID=568900 RepID=A0A9N8EPP9_9STRA|nr:alkyl hydroperoxide reductase Thiol specific antioxidant Mal allergen [Seminavis robusta]CAB9531822.1 alkyl hydroperoxide reductase Thiol specific antioxidant Mal allergen [Seminavis robusta]|eukprot:Sro1505_g278220.1 alkyl hydroperoxide reductase Thiol specific antioxidant Mal allergen (170) ;mRNA; r:17505-18103
MALPDLPLRCLTSAEAHTTTDVVSGRNTIIDFWTTRCTRCPDALDKLDKLAQDPQYNEIKFISICCDQLDGAREIIEKDNDPRWSHIAHYFMAPNDKETAKKVLGFKSVPFYVVLDKTGNIVQKGGASKVDFDNVPGILVIEEDKENSKPDQIAGAPEEQVFMLEDLDF